MEKNLFGFTAIDEKEAVIIVGGVDKGAQEALYAIGYAIGCAVRYIVGLFDKLKNVFTKKS